MRALRKDASLVDRILEAIDVGDADDLEDLLDELANELERAARAGVDAAIVQIDIDDEGILDVANDRAIAYAEDRAAEMVGRRWINGELVENPNVEWRIDEATRDMVRESVEQAMSDGLSNDDLAAMLNEHYAFSEDRAMTIARTETAFADIEGNLAVYRETGITEKQWLAAPDCCDECQELDGAIAGIDEEFQGGGPPLHPNCRCDVLPVTEYED